ncbi:HDIG domain-containing protein [Candidatus Bipolaricaulota bacterium]|nr:HDIG domain-containing protein [Candidatus Bipolaricaulota bacterium]
MDRGTALRLVEDNVSEDNLIKHMKAVEAGMRELARHFGEDEDEWGIAGLLHDLDYEETEDEPDKHGLLTVKKLEERDDINIVQLDAIKAHAGQKPPENKMEKSIYATDPLTGLIVAGALVHPEGLGEMDPEFIRNRYEEKSFAKSVDREAIATCENLGFELEEFFGIVLSGMQNIQGELGL